MDEKDQSQRTGGAIPGPAGATGRAGETPAAPLTSGALARVLVSALEAADPETSGARIGRYKLVEKIGEGGFGTVWLADSSSRSRRLCLRSA